jgi:hypothetical protein
MPTGDSRDNAQLQTATFDAALVVKDAGAITSSAAATVGGNAQVIDLGDAYVEGRLNIDISAIDFATGDEKYEIQLQFSDGDDFSGDDVFAIALHLGDAATGRTDQAKTGRFHTMWCNRFLDSTGLPKNFRYVRAYTIATGTSPSLNWEGWISKAC